jgi:hypothetical protein
MTMPPTEPSFSPIIDPYTALTGIRTAWRQGRSIVPLIGAGLSTESGIPTTGELVSYLAKIKYYLSSLETTSQSLTSPAEYRSRLLLTGWPGPFEINDYLLECWMKLADQINENLAERRTRLGDTETDLPQPTPPDPRESFSAWLASRVETVFMEELARDHPSLKSHIKPYSNLLRGNWRALLRRLSDGDPVLIDSFFNQLVRGRSPATGQQFVAFLAQLMGWKLVLTTNFDSLIEAALRDYGLDPTVYELPEHGPAPDPGLVRDNFSVVKLHGGGFGLRVGESLDAPLDVANIARFVNYMPSDPLLLVLGYGGADRRVMSLVEAIAMDVGRASDFRVLWVFRTKAPWTIEGVSKFGGKVRLVQYRDASLFLHEMYTRLTTSHPVSSSSYRALRYIPPWIPDRDVTLPPDGAQDGGFNALQEYPVVIFASEHSGSGTSTQLARFVQSLRGFLSVVWCDLEELPTVASLVSHVFYELQRFDPDILPVLVDPGSPELEGGARKPDARVERIVQALRRGKYIVAIDSLGEFGRSQVGHDVSEPSADVILRLGEVYAFLEELISRAEEFGESKLCISLTPWNPLEGIEGPPTGCSASRDVREHGGRLALLRSRARGLGDAFRVFLVGMEEKRLVRWGLVPKTVDAPFVDSEVRRALARVLREPNSGLPEFLRDNGFRLGDGARLIWEALEPEYQVLLGIASAFRRPRSIVALRRLGAVFLRTRKESIGEALLGLANPRDLLSHAGIADADFEKVDGLLRELGACRLLLNCQEGGFYWMHRAVRDSIYRGLLEGSPQGAGELHSLIASYYYELLFRPSNDSSAFLEYIYHRAASVRGCPAPARNERLRELLGALQREGQHIVAEAETGKLLGIIRAFRSEVLDVLYRDARAGLEETSDVLRAEFWEIEERLRARLCDLEALVCRKATDFRGSMRIRLQQVVDRLEEPTRGRAEFAPELITLVSAAKIDGLRVRMAEMDSSVVEKDAQGEGLLDDESLATLTRVVARRDVLDLYAKGSVEYVDKGSRLIEHLLEIGLCLKGMRDYGRATSVFLAVNECLPRPPVLSGQFRSRVVATEVACSFRLMEVYLSQVHPWPLTGEHSARNGEFLEMALKEFDKGWNLLRTFAGWDDREYGRYKCYLNSLGSRVAYLQNKFYQAYLLLDDARAAVYRALDTAGQTALAVCYLHQSECLMLRADYGMKGLGGERAEANIEERKRGGEGVRKAQDRLQVAGMRLNRAEGFLRLGAGILLKGQRNVWWCTWTSLLQGQLEHERFALSMSPRPLEPEDAFREGCIRRGLRAIAMGLGNIQKDRVRRGELATLWWQLLLCVHACRPEETLGFTAEWKNVNRMYGLGWFVAEQEAKLGLMGACWLEAVRAGGSSADASSDGRARLLQLEAETFKAYLERRRVLGEGWRSSAPCSGGLGRGVPAPKGMRRLLGVAVEESRRKS